MQRPCEHRQASQGEAVCPPKEGLLPLMLAPLWDFTLPSNAAVTSAVHAPTGHGLITLSFPSHELHIENASDSSQDNRDVLRT